MISNVVFTYSFFNAIFFFPVNVDFATSYFDSLKLKLVLYKSSDMFQLQNIIAQCNSKLYQAQQQQIHANRVYKE